MKEDLKLGIYSSFHFIDEIAVRQPVISFVMLYTNYITCIIFQKGNYPENEQILIISDAEYKYGQNWLVCVTLEARDKMLNVRSSHT